MHQRMIVGLNNFGYVGTLTSLGLVFGGFDEMFIESIATMTISDKIKFRT